jgi:thioredoxin-related protein
MRKMILTGVFALLMGIPTQAQNTETLTWHTLSEALVLNATTPKKFLIDVYTDWCGWCKVMDKNTFQHATIAGIIDKYFYAVKFNAEKDGEVTYQGKTYQLVIDPNSKKGYHELTNVLMNNQASGYPTICYMDESTNIIQAVSGYLTPEQIEPILMFFGTNAYKTTSWETFTASFTTQLK